MPARKSVTREILRALNTSFSLIFADAFKASAPMWNKLANKVNSSSSIETYTWLNQIPGMKLWVGERNIKRLEQEAYTLKNDKFEDTVAVKREAIEDDNLGVYKMAISGMSGAAAEHPDELVFNALSLGFEKPCFDGQNFFDEEHPVRKDGKDFSVSNMQGGDGPAWYLLCTNKPVMPLIYQERIAPDLIIHDDPESSDRVFMQDEFLYGVRSRGAAGYSYWQLAFASKAPLTKENFEAARKAMMEIRGDEGRPLNIVPNLLVIPPALETAAEEILVVERLDNGKTNPNKGKAEILMTPWLAG